MRGERKTGTYYVQYRLPKKDGRLGRTRYSKNFKTKSEAKRFVNMVRRKGGTFNAYFSKSIISDEVVWG